MSIVGWFILGVSIAAYLCSWRYIAGRIAWHEKSHHRDRPNGNDIGWGMFCGVWLAPFVPIIIAVEFLSRTGTGDLIRERLLYTPPEHREELRQ